LGLERCGSAQSRSTDYTGENREFIGCLNRKIISTPLTIAESGPIPPPICLTGMEATYIWAQHKTDYVLRNITLMPNRFLGH
jgi:hypothetical protein